MFLENLPMKLLSMLELNSGKKAVNDTAFDFSEMPLFDWATEILKSDHPLITMRDYQIESSELALESIGSSLSPVLWLPTGSGKSIIIADLCRKLNGRILVVTHRKELLLQNESKVKQVGVDDVGIFSAGLKRRDLSQQIIVGGIQSIERQMAKIQEFGMFDYIIVDECHLVPPPALPGKPKSRYQKVFESCPGAKRIGLSATPYRLNQGYVWSESGDLWFDHLAIHIKMIDLIDHDPPYLSEPIGVETAAKPDLAGVRKQGGEFKTRELSEASRKEDVLELALDEACDLGGGRDSWVVFCVDIDHTHDVEEGLRKRGREVRSVTGKTRPDERAQAIVDVECGAADTLVNCETMTTGLDIPRLDCCVLLRASESEGLITQMIGRVTRLSPETGKKNALVLDMGGNLARHAPLDGIRKQKKSPKRIMADVKIELKKREEESRIKKKKEEEEAARHSAMAARNLSPLRGKNSRGQVDLRVDSITYKKIPSKKYPGKKNILVSYKGITESGDKVNVPCWLCLEYTGFVRGKAEAWYSRRGERMAPISSDAAFKSIYKLPKPSFITVIKKNGFYDLVNERFEGQKQLSW